MFEFFDRSENIFQFKLYFFSTDSKLTQLDFSIPKAPVSVQVQSGFRKVEPSSKRKELSTDDIDSKDQCATQWMDSHVSSRLIYKVKCQWASIDNFNC